MGAAPSIEHFGSNLATFDNWAQIPRRGCLESPGRPKALSRVLGHHLATNPLEGLVEEARMTESEVSVPFWAISGQMPSRCSKWATFCNQLNHFPSDDLSELVSFRNNPLFEIAFHSEWFRNNPEVTATCCYFCEFQISFHLGLFFHSY